MWEVKLTEKCQDWAWQSNAHDSNKNLKCCNSMYTLMLTSVGGVFGAYRPIVDTGGHRLGLKLASSI